MKIVERNHNLETNQIVDLERNETSQEKAQREALENENAKLAIEAAAKSEKRIALLERLGITEEEAKLLLG